MNYLLNQETVSLADLYLFAIQEKYRGPKGPFWVSNYLWLKGYEVQEKTKHGIVDLGSK